MTERTGGLPTSGTAAPATSFSCQVPVVHRHPGARMLGCWFLAPTVGWFAKAEVRAGTPQGTDGTSRSRSPV